MCAATAAITERSGPFSTTKLTSASRKPKTPKRSRSVGPRDVARYLQTRNPRWASGMVRKPLFRWLSDPLSHTQDQPRKGIQLSGDASGRVMILRGVVHLDEPRDLFKS